MCGSTADSLSPGKGKIPAKHLVWKSDNTDGTFECIINIFEEQM